jgi:hypothetical protein
MKKKVIDSKDFEVFVLDINCYEIPARFITTPIAAGL